jgi:hypothetical protein
VTPVLDIPYLPHFTASALENDWPPGWLPATDWGKDAVAHSQAAQKGRQTMLDNGIDGSIAGISRLADIAIANYRRER